MWSVRICKHCGSLNIRLCYQGWREYYRYYNDDDSEWEPGESSEDELYEEYCDECGSNDIAEITMPDSELIYFALLNREQRLRYLREVLKINMEESSDKRKPALDISKRKEGDVFVVDDEPISNNFVFTSATPFDGNTTYIFVDTSSYTSGT